MLPFIHLRHVAIATVAGLEMVVSWNHRHLANERKSDGYNAVNRLAGYDQVQKDVTHIDQGLDRLRGRPLSRRWLAMGNLTADDVLRLLWARLAEKESRDWRRRPLNTKRCLSPLLGTDAPGPTRNGCASSIRSLRVTPLAQEGSSHAS